jgi:DNA-binding LacI/PurR family transcriptional regulator
VANTPVSIREVAALAGVSLGTVSNVLNHPEVVAERTRARVQVAIKELGFIRNESARQLRAGRSRTIGLVVLDVANPFFTDVARGAAAVAVPLSSVRQPRHQLGRAAAQLLIEEALGDGTHRHRQVVSEPDLVVRRSSSVQPRRSRRSGPARKAAAATAAAAGEAAPAADGAVAARGAAG